MMMKFFLLLALVPAIAYAAARTPSSCHECGGRCIKSCQEAEIELPGDPSARHCWGKRNICCIPAAEKECYRAGGACLTESACATAGGTELTDTSSPCTIVKDNLRICCAVNKLGLVCPATDYTVEVLSSGGIHLPYPPSYFKVNGEYLTGENVPRFRGINIVSLHPTTGELIIGKNFDTYLGHEATMVAFIKDDIPVNSVVLVSVWDEASRNCNTACKEAIASLGGDISTLGFRDQFAMIGYKSEDGTMPSFVQQDQAGEWDPTPLSVSATISLW